jgi:hypothetical protein
MWLESAEKLNHIAEAFIGLLFKQLEPPPTAENIFSFSWSEIEVIFL